MSPILPLLWLYCVLAAVRRHSPGTATGSTGFRTIQRIEKEGGCNEGAAHPLYQPL